MRRRVRAYERWNMKLSGLRIYGERERPERSSAGAEDFGAYLARRSWYKGAFKVAWEKDQGRGRLAGDVLIMTMAGTARPLTRTRVVRKIPVAL
jgi:hypothetical protein